MPKSHNSSPSGRSPDQPECPYTDPHPTRRRGRDAAGRLIHGLVRGPEGGTDCHVNVQVSPSELNFHVRYSGYQYTVDRDPIGLSSADDVAAILAAQAADFFVRSTVGEDFDEVSDWYYDKTVTRLTELAALSGTTAP